MPVQVIYITAALLVAGALPLPFDLHEILFITAFGTFAWGAYTNFGRKKILFAVTCTLFAVLFNPIREITLFREIWIAADLAGAIVLITGKKYFEG
ncbi:MAG: DUF6804 family protein [Chlorobiaceae bacterium]